MYDILELTKKSIEELRSIAEGLKLKKINGLEKEPLIYRIIDEQAIQGVSEPAPKKKKKRERIVPETKPVKTITEVKPAEPAPQAPEQQQLQLQIQPQPQPQSSPQSEKKKRGRKRKTEKTAEQAVET